MGPNFHLFQTSFQLTWGLGKANLQTAPWECARVPQDNFQVRWFARRTYRTQPIVTFVVMSCYSKRIQNTISKEKRCLEWNLEETRWNLLRVLSQPITHLIPPAKTVTICGKYCIKGSSLETQCPGILLGTGHEAVLYLACTKIPDSQKESRCSS